MAMRSSWTSTPLLLLLAGAALAPPVEAGGAVRAALDYLQRHTKQLKLAGSDIADVVVSSQVKSRHSGVTHVYLQQRHRGIEVHNARKPPRRPLIT